LKLRPLSDRIVVERIAGNERTEGGLFLPDSVKEKERPQLGLVLAVGPGKKLESFRRYDDQGDEIAARSPMDVQVGDLVLFQKYCGHSQSIGRGVEVLVMGESDVLCVVEQELPDDGTAAEGN
jgi:chaperonin GroES